MTRSSYRPKSFKTQSKVKHVSAVVKLIPALCIGLRPHGGIYGLRGGTGKKKAKKESFVNRERVLTGKIFIKLLLGTVQFGRNLL